MRHLVSLAAGLLVLVACNGAAQPTPAGPEPAPGEPTDGATVSIFDFGYDPATLNASVGETVTWTNDGGVPHTVSFEEGEDSGSMSAGEAFSRTFDELGTFTYACRIHPQMQGVVNVNP